MAKKDKKPTAKSKKTAAPKKQSPPAKTTTRTKHSPAGRERLFSNVKENTALSAQTVKNSWAYRKIAASAQEHRHTSPHRSFRFTRRSETREYEKIPAWWRLVARTARILKREWKKIIPLVAIFAPIAWLVSGVFNQQFALLKNSLNLFDEEALSFGEELLALGTGFIASQSSVPQDALVLLNIFGLIIWLSFVWIARYSYAGKPTSMRQALYTSPSAFVPFLLLTILLIIQLLPATLAAVIFFSLQGGGFTETILEKVLFAILGLLLVVLSLYFIISTVIALQVATLPGMYPWRALRNARKLVMNRRFAVLRKVIMLPVIIVLFFAVTLIPLLALDNAVCSEGTCWSTVTLLPMGYYGAVGLALAFASIYLYVTYRALLEQEDDYI